MPVAVALMMIVTIAALLAQDPALVLAVMKVLLPPAPLLHYIIMVYSSADTRTSKKSVKPNKTKPATAKVC